MAKIENLPSPIKVTLDRKKCSEEIYIPVDVVQYINGEMKDAPPAHLAKMLEVTPSMISRIRKGDKVKASFQDIMRLVENVRKEEFYSFKSRLTRQITTAENAKLYIELNQYLSKMIVEMPPSIRKLVRSRKWNSTALAFSCDPLWVIPIGVIQTLVKLKQWAFKIHRRCPEFDQVLFGGTGLLEDFKESVERHKANTEITSE